MDEHIFTCPGYQDLVPENVTLDLFWDADTLNDMETMERLGRMMKVIIERMDRIQEIDVSKVPQ